MTDRAEIERLLQMTGRTLEGLPETYSSEEREKHWHELVGNMKFGDVLLHQSDVIELLIGALRDALDKQPKWISVDGREPEFPCIYWDGINQIGITKTLATITLKSGKTVYLSDLFLKAFPDITQGEVDNCTHIMFWMPLPELPKEGE